MSYDDRSLGLLMNLGMFRFLSILLMLANIYLGTFKPLGLKDTTLLRRLGFSLASLMLLLPYSDEYVVKLTERVNGVETINDGAVCEVLRIIVAMTILMVANFSVFLYAGYEMGYKCSLEKCYPACLQPKGYHPGSWDVNFVDYYLVCTLVFFPLGWAMSSSYIWFDTTDFGLFFSGSSSLLNKTLLMSNSTMNGTMMS